MVIMREFYQGLWIMWRKKLRWKNIWAVMTQFVIRKMPHLPSTAPWTTGRSHSERCSSNGCKKNSKKPKKSKPPKTPECDQSQFWMDNKCPAALVLIGHRRRSLWSPFLPLSGGFINSCSLLTTHPISRINLFGTSTEKLVYCFIS